LSISTTNNKASYYSVYDSPSQGTKRWYDVIDTLVDNYNNNAYHSTIKAKPKDVFFSDGVGTHQIAKNIKAAAHKMVTAGTVTTGWLV